MAIQWTKDWVIDGGIIDADHQVLIEIINGFSKVPDNDLDKKVLKGLLLKLVRYAEMHFVREERLQELVEFGLRFPHQKAHGRFVDQLQVYQRQLFDCADDNIIAFAKELDQFLSGWLEDHVLKEDMRMQPYVAEIRKKQREKMSLEDLVKQSQAAESEKAKARKPDYEALESPQ